MTQMHQKERRASDFCLRFTLSWSQSPSSCQAWWTDTKCLFLEWNIWPLSPTWKLTGTQRAAWLHVPTMRPHKKHQLSRTGRPFLRRLSMQLCSPPLPTSQSGWGEYNVVSVVVQIVQETYGDKCTCLSWLEGFCLQEMLRVKRDTRWMGHLHEWMDVGGWLCAQYSYSIYVVGRSYLCVNLQFHA